MLTISTSPMRALVDRLPHRAEVRVEAAVEADHQLRRRSPRRPRGRPAPGRRRGRSASRRRSPCRPGRSARSGRHGCRSGCRSPPRRCRPPPRSPRSLRTSAPCCAGERLRRRRHRVGDRDEAGVRVAGDRPGMHLADAPGAEQAETNSSSFPHSAWRGTRRPRATTRGASGEGRRPGPWPRRPSRR